MDITQILTKSKVKSKHKKGSGKNKSAIKYNKFVF